MSAAHQIKKVQEAIFAGWVKGKRRKVDGVVYATRRDAARARTDLRNKLKFK